MEGVKNNGIALAIVALFLLSSKSHKMKIPTVSTKSSTWAWGTKNLEKKTKILKRYAGMMKFHEDFFGGRAAKEGGGA
jgi:hypothetical protein